MSVMVERHQLEGRVSAQRLTSYLVGCDGVLAELLFGLPGHIRIDVVGQFRAGNFVEGLHFEVEVVLLANLAKATQQRGALLCRGESPGAQYGEVVNIEKRRQGAELNPGAQRLQCVFTLTPISQSLQTKRGTPFPASPIDITAGPGYSAESNAHSRATTLAGLGFRLATGNSGKTKQRRAKHPDRCG